MADADNRGRSGGARRAARSVRTTPRGRARKPGPEVGKRAARPTPTVPTVPTAPTPPAAAAASTAGKRAARRDPAPPPGRRIATPADRAASTPAARTSSAGARTRRVSTESAARPERVKGGSRALRPPQRRTRGLLGTLGLTFVGAVVPGTGYLFAGRRAAGWVVFAGWAVVAGLAVWHFGRDWHRVVDLALDPTALKIGALVLALLLVVWVMVVWTSYRLIRPRERPRWHTVVGNIAVVVVCLVVAAPVLQAARYALATADFVGNVFGDNDTATTPDDATADNPFGDRRRVNVLLLGGDGGKGREGVRTDSMILLSIDTRTGKTVTFSLPRNMEKARFPAGTPLAELYPYGFAGGEPGDGDYMLNAVYRNIPILHPEVLGKSSNEGADAIKLAVSGTLGLPVDYYVLVNLDGFKQIVDAIGGVTVNINEPVAIGGDTSAGIPPADYLEPGPDQHLDGFQALWFSRGRWGSDDYDRMERQRCMVDAIIEAADPANLLLRYLDLIKAGKKIVFTDIPQELASAFVNLAIKVKGAKIKSVVFQRSAEFDSADPDFIAIQERVQRALEPKRRTGESRPVSAPEDAEDVCAYRPVTASEESSADAAQ